MRQVIEDLPESKIREVANAAIGRSDVLPFWFGESDEPTPDFICEAAARSLADAETPFIRTTSVCPSFAKRSRATRARCTARSTPAGSRSRHPASMR